jgi:hypothetical protein
MRENPLGPDTFTAAILKSYNVLVSKNGMTAVVAAEFVSYVIHVPTGDVFL